MADQYNVFAPKSRSLFRRCVQCPSGTPSCPSCGPDETCSLKAPSCDACASTSCVKIGSLPGQLATKHSTPIGSIVGGVICGVVAIGVITYLVWRFCVRPKREAMAAWESPEKRDQSTLHRSDRRSTRSGHSIASTVLTRASNVIQIAYIPGVTVRSPPDSPALLAPPVPSVRAYSSNASSPAVEQHFFMPGDLRDSTCSDTSSNDPRVSLAPSLARSTFYGENELVPPVPAQQAYRAHANVVSVRTGSTTPSMSAKTPPVPQMPSLGDSKSSIVARNVTARPIEVRKPGSGPRVPTLANLARHTSNKSQATASSEKSVPVFYDEKEAVVSPTTIIDESPSSPIMKPKPSLVSVDSARSSSVSAIIPAEGPLGSGPRGAVHRHNNSTGLDAMIEEAINRARDPHLSVQPRPHRPELGKHDSGPFSDANEVKENLL